MTRKEAINKLNWALANNTIEDVQSAYDYIIAIKMAIKALEQEPCEDIISRKSIKQKLQEHHDFFINAYGGFSNLPLNDKSRVDEITNCIAMVVNEPSVTPQEPRQGHWVHGEYCSECGWDIPAYIIARKWQKYMDTTYCPNCGTKMVELQESEG